jgi:hypothetical protein
MTDGFFAAQIRAEGDALVMGGPGGKGTRLRHQGEGVFLMEDEAIQLTFEGPPGPASGMLVTMYGMALPSVRVPCAASSVRRRGA